jgi:nucleoside phosphorylase
MREWGSTLFCGAFDGETDLLARIAGLKVYNAGVGIHDSLFNLQRYLARTEKIKSIIFLGSAGAYPHSPFHIGDIVWSHKFLYRDIAEIRNMAKIPDVVTKHVLTKQDKKTEGLIESLNISQTITNSMNYVTLIDFTQEELIASLYDVGVENMEAFSLAYVANRFNLSFTALFFVTNIVGANGSLDWTRNWRDGSNILQKRVIKHIHGKTR